MKGEFFEAKITGFRDAVVYRIDINGNTLQIDSLKKGRIIAKLNNEVVAETDGTSLNFELFIGGEKFEVEVYLHEGKKFNRVAIWINNRFVKKTYSDPVYGIRKGRVGIGFFIVIIILELAYAFVSVVKQHGFNKIVVAVFATISLVYIIPLIILIYYFFRFRRKYFGALIAGTIVGLLDILGVIWALRQSPGHTGTGGLTLRLIFWVYILLSFKDAKAYKAREKLAAKENREIVPE